MSQRKPAARGWLGLSTFLTPLVGLLFALFLSPPFLFARGDADLDAEKKVELNSEWIICVTAFDVSLLPPSQRINGEITARRIARTIAAIGTRERSDAEQSAYVEKAWEDARAAAGKILAEKRETRDALLFKGLSDWKYKKELESVDVEIEAAEKKMEEAIDAQPLVSSTPKITLAKGNADGALPTAPESGKESLFCEKGGYDVVLIGSMEPFYDRIRLTVRLYSVYIHSFIYEDRIIFSSEDREIAISELEEGLTTSIAYASTSALAIKVDPTDADIVVDGDFLGHGTIGPVERKPGKTTIEISSPGHESATVPLELTAGELSRVSVVLPEKPTSDLTVETIPSGASIRVGALYQGNSPLIVSVPDDSSLFISAEAQDNLGASRVVSDGGSLEFKLDALPDPDEQIVENARHKFYGAFGRFWLALPAAFVMSGVAQSYVDAWNLGQKAEIYNDAYNMELASIVGWVVVGCFAVESIYKFVHYLHVSDHSATPMAYPTK